VGSYGIILIINYVLNRCLENNAMLEQELDERNEVVYTML